MLSAKADDRMHTPAQAAMTGITGGHQSPADTGAGDTSMTHQAVLEKIEKKKKENPPLLYNLAELQNDCSGCSRSVRMKRCGWYRNCMKKNW